MGFAIAIGVGVGIGGMAGGGAAPPSAPANLAAAVNGNGISLTWDAVNGAVTYTVYRGTSSGTETSYATLIGTNSTTDLAVTPGTTYFYKVTAVNAGGESAKSNEASAGIIDLSADSPTIWFESDSGTIKTSGSGAISTIAVVSNVASVTTTAAHGMTTGSVVEIAGTTAVASGQYTLTSALTGTTFTFAVTHANSSDSTGTWKDATPSANAGTMGRWIDRSSHANDMKQVAPDTPATFLTNIQNSLPAISLNGSSDSLNFVSSISLVGDWTIFLVCRTADKATQYAPLGGSDVNVQFIIGQTNDCLSTYEGANNPVSSTMPIAQTSFSVLEFSRTGTTVTFLQNGVSLGTGTFQASPGPITTFSGISFGTAKLFKGQFLALYMLPSVDATKRQHFRTYAQAKWQPP